jgi:hypothetical protein
MKDKWMREQSLVLVLHERRVKEGNVHPPAHCEG